MKLLSTLHLIFFGACARTTVPGILFFYRLYKYQPDVLQAKLFCLYVY